MGRFQVKDVFGIFFDNRLSGNFAESFVAAKKAVKGNFLFQRGAYRPVERAAVRTKVNGKSFYSVLNNDRIKRKLLAKMIVDDNGVN